MRPSGRNLLLFLLFLFAGTFGSLAFGQCPITPDVNADRAVGANDALILYYAYSLRSELGNGRGEGGDTSPLANGARFRDCDNLPEMVVVPSGTFTMGSPDDEAGRVADEQPRHSVTIGYRFAVGRYEVTFAEWEVCRELRQCTYNPRDSNWGRGTRPVIDVSWDDAKEYVAWLSRETGARYRLLSESEWEYAARAGTQTPYHWGDDVVGDNSGKANCVGCGGDWDYPEERKGERQTAPVGSYDANAFGLHDMLGNVWEWVEDCSHLNYGDEDGNVIAPLNGDAWGEENGGNCMERMVRGGSWSSKTTGVRSANREDILADRRGSTSHGFRVARDLG